LFVTPLRPSSVSVLTTGETIDPQNHVLFLEEEFGSALGAAQLPGGTAVGSYTSADIPDPSAVCPEVTSWSNAGDPHGLAIYTGAIDGKEKGLLIDSSTKCLAIIDLDAFIAAPQSAGTHRAMMIDAMISFVPLP
jgi:hypothetical protein